MIGTDLVELVVVDDDADLRMLATIAFESEGWRVASAADGVEGLDLLRTLTTEGARPVVLLDVQMPHIDGWEVLATIRADPDLAELAVVLCTVRAGEEDRAKGIGLGADGFVAKPFGIDELIAQVGDVRDLTPTERQERRRRLGGEGPMPN